MFLKSATITFFVDLVAIIWNYSELIHIEFNLFHQTAIDKSHFIYISTVWKLISLSPLEGF